MIMLKNNNKCKIIVIDKNGELDRLKELHNWLRKDCTIVVDSLEDDPVALSCNNAELVIIHTELIDEWCKKAAECQNVVFLFVSNDASSLISVLDERCKLTNCHPCEYPADQLHKNEYFIKFIKEYKKGNKRWDLLKYPSPEHLIALYLLDIPFTNPPAEGFKENFERSAKQVWKNIYQNAAKELGHCKDKFGDQISFSSLPGSWEDHEQRKQYIAEVLSKL